MHHIDLEYIMGKAKIFIFNFHCLLGYILILFLQKCLLSSTLRFICFVLIPYFDRLLEPDKGYINSASLFRKYYVSETSTLYTCSRHKPLHKLCFIPGGDELCLL